MKAVLFKVIREKVGGETVRVLLQPMRDEDRIHIEEGDEFATGTLKLTVEDLYRDR